MRMTRRLTAVGVLLGCVASPMAANADGGKFVLSDQSLDGVSAGLSILATASGLNIALANTRVNTIGTDDIEISAGNGISVGCCGKGSRSNVSSNGRGGSVTVRIPFVRASISIGAAAEINF